MLEFLARHFHFIQLDLLVPLGCILVCVVMCCVLRYVIIPRVDAYEVQNPDAIIWCSRQRVLARRLLVALVLLLLFNAYMAWAIYQLTF